jgi:pimeloyl-ACP methyl ester carboxylesterase
MTGWMIYWWIYANRRIEMNEQVIIEQKTVVSADGTIIAYEQSGAGPAIVLVSAALSDRADAVKLAKRLARSFTVINYDRRGRGKSTDTPPYAAAREIDDVEALLEAVGPAYLFGSSSGAVLALDAANRLGSRVRGLFLYEPPLIVDNSRPPMPDDFAGRVRRLVDAGRNSDAVRLFFTQGMGIPGLFVTLMRWLMPGWSKMAGMAHTLEYDLALTQGVQTGQPLPAGRWAQVQARTLVMAGEKSETFFHTGAQALAGLLPAAEYRPLPGRDHGAILSAPQDLAAALEGFFLAEGTVGLAISGS